MQAFSQKLLLEYRKQQSSQEDLQNLGKEILQAVILRMREELLRRILLHHLALIRRVATSRAKPT